MEYLTVPLFHGEKTKETIFLFTVGWHQGLSVPLNVLWNKNAFHHYWSKVKYFEVYLPIYRNFNTCMGLMSSKNWDSQCVVKTFYVSMIFAAVLVATCVMYYVVI